jgi:hypothetical protein
VERSKCGEVLANWRIACIREDKTLLGIETASMENSSNGFRGASVGCLFVPKT